MRKILITGSAGFSGKYLIKYLLNKKEYDIVGVDKKRSGLIEEKDIDLTKKEQLSIFLKNYRPDIIFHLAGTTKSNFYKEFYKNNLFTTINLLERLVENELFNTNILLISSAAVYGNPKTNPVKEENSTEPINYYGSSKLAMEKIAMQFFKNYNLKINIARTFNIIGTGQPNTFVIPQIISKLNKLKKNDMKQIIKMGNLDYRRDYVDIRDVVKAYWEIVENNIGGIIYNVGSGQSYSVVEIIEKIAKIMKINVKIKKLVLPKKNGEIKEIVADIRKIKKIGWQPEINIEQTLKRMVMEK